MRKAGALAALLVFAVTTSGCSGQDTTSSQGPRTDEAAARDDRGAAARPGGERAFSDEDGASVMASIGSWEEAEAIAGTRYGGDPSRLERHPRIEYLFVTGGPSFLVFDGAVVRGGGLEALARYARTFRLQERQHLEAEDVALLVERFRAFPPRAQGERNFLRKGRGPEVLQPAVRYEDDVALLELHYRLEPGGASENPRLEDVETWTLALPVEGEASWSSRRRHIDGETGEVLWEQGT